MTKERERISIQMRIFTKLDSSLGEVITWLNEKDEVVVNELVKRALIMVYLAQAKGSKSLDLDKRLETYRDMQHLWNLHDFTMREVLDIPFQKASPLLYQENSNSFKSSDASQFIKRNTEVVIYEEESLEEEESLKATSKSIYFDDDEFIDRLN